MRKMMGLIAAGLVLSVAGVNAQEASRRALAEELLNLMNMQENIEKSFAMVKQMIPAQMEKMKQATGQTNIPSNGSSQTDSMMDMMARELSWDKMKDDYITLYAETFTEDEMKGIIAFYKSPAGQAFTKKQPELMKRSMELSQKIALQIMPKIPSFTKASEMSQQNACINNLRQIESAKDQYALEHGLTNGATVTFANIGPTTTGVSYLQIWPVCPAASNANPISGTQSMTEQEYEINVIGQNVRCRIMPDKHALP